MCVCDCMYVTAGVRERDHTDTVQLHCYIIMIICSHYYVLSALFINHDTGGEITFLLFFPLSFQRLLHAYKRPLKFTQIW